ncbi:MAG: peptide MFS transporter [Myxococcales bacterium]|nr:peptide MFS transporter [Myxococcales bacterium]
MTATSPPPASATLFGHPTGLFALFFAEMWERFSYYGMRALLVFYMIKGFLGYGDAKAYAVYGAYTAMVYATPFIGGMLADRLLGTRRAVILGGLLMSAGHLLMTLQHETAFFTALALLICGNGFFKPNISTTVGSLYPDASPRRDSGFTIFYMGINLGAAMSPLICGYIGETYGWHYGFGLATVGMLVGLAVFVAPIRLTQILILSGALGTAIALLFLQNSALQLMVNAAVAAALAAGGIIACVAFARGGLPPEVGAPPDPSALTRKLAGALRADFAVYLGVAIAIPIFTLLVQRNQIAGWMLFLFGGAAVISLLVEAFRCETVERQRLFVVLILMFYSMLFWSFFEQAGSSVNNFTDRNVDRVFEDRTITASDIGSTITIELNQEQLGHRLGDRLIVLDDVDEARASGETEVEWLISEADVGMGVGGAEIRATIFQAANPIFILTFGLALTGLWAFLGPRGWEPRTPVKFALGLLQLGLGFGAFWYGAHTADSRGMVAMSWLLIGYLLQTTGELCLSPVGLSMVTTLSPKRIVGTVMGAWFLATAFSQFLAGIIAGFTGVEHQAGGSQGIPAPIETVGIYGEVFGKIAIAAIVSAASLFALSPLLNRWIHSDNQESTD